MTATRTPIGRKRGTRNASVSRTSSAQRKRSSANQVQPTMSIPYHSAAPPLATSPALPTEPQVSQAGSKPAFEDPAHPQMDSRSRSARKRFPLSQTPSSTPHMLQNISQAFKAPSVVTTAAAAALRVVNSLHTVDTVTAPGEMAPNLPTGPVLPSTTSAKPQDHNSSKEIAVSSVPASTSGSTAPVRFPRRASDAATASQRVKVRTLSPARLDAPNDLVTMPTRASRINRQLFIDGLDTSRDSSIPFLLRQDNILPTIPKEHSINIGEHKPHISVDTIPRASMSLPALPSFVPRLGFQPLPQHVPPISNDAYLEEVVSDPELELQQEYDETKIEQRLGATKVGPQPNRLHDARLENVARDPPPPNLNGDDATIDDSLDPSRLNASATVEDSPSILLRKQSAHRFINGADNGFDENGERSDDNGINTANNVFPANENPFQDKLNDGIDAGDKDVKNIGTAEEDCDDDRNFEIVMNGKKHESGAVETNKDDLEKSPAHRGDAGPSETRKTAPSRNAVRESRRLHIRRGGVRRKAVRKIEAIAETEGVNDSIEYNEEMSEGGKRLGEMSPRVCSVDNPVRELNGNGALQELTCSGSNEVELRISKESQIEDPNVNQLDDPTQGLRFSKRFSVAQADKNVKELKPGYSKGKTPLSNKVASQIEASNSKSKSRKDRTIERLRRQLILAEAAEDSDDLSDIGFRNLDGVTQNEFENQAPDNPPETTSNEASPRSLFKEAENRGAAITSSEMHGLSIVAAQNADPGTICTTDQKVVTDNASRTSRRVAENSFNSSCILKSKERDEPHGALTGPGTISKTGPGDVGKEKVEHKRESRELRSQQRQTMDEIDADTAVRFEMNSGQDKANEVDQAVGSSDVNTNAMNMGSGDVGRSGRGRRKVVHSSKAREFTVREIEQNCLDKNELEVLADVEVSGSESPLFLKRRNVARDSTRSAIAGTTSSGKSAFMSTNTLPTVVERGLASPPSVVRRRRKVDMFCDDETIINAPIAGDGGDINISGKAVVTKRSPRLALGSKQKKEEKINVGNNSNCHSTSGIRSMRRERKKAIGIETDDPTDDIAKAKTAADCEDGLNSVNDGTSSFVGIGTEDFKEADEIGDIIIPRVSPRWLKKPGLRLPVSHARRSVGQKGRVTRSTPVRQGTERNTNGELDLFGKSDGGVSGDGISTPEDNSPDFTPPGNDRLVTKGKRKKKQSEKSKSSGRKIVRTPRSGRKRGRKGDDEAGRGNEWSRDTTEAQTEDGKAENKVSQQKKRKRMSEVFMLQKALASAAWTDSREVEAQTEVVPIEDDPPSMIVQGLDHGSFLPLSETVRKKSPSMRQISLPRSDNDSPFTPPRRSK